MTVVKCEDERSRPEPVARVFIFTLMGSTGTGWALRRRLIKLLSAGWVPHVRNPSPDVVVRAPLHLPGPQRQQRLSAVKCLHLRLLIHAQDQGSLG